MRKLSIILGLLLCSTPAWATNYFIAPAGLGGNDANNGTSSGTPWLTPNHSVNCGDVITATASAAYLHANFTFNDWGPVTCADGNNVAWLQCATFDACIITVASGDGMDLDRSFWGIQGWEVDDVITGGACFNVFPGAAVQLSHIIFANDVANTCGLGGFNSGANVGASVGTDYLTIIGSIAYNTTGNTTACDSGIDIVYPIASDTLPGTHDYFAGNFLFGTVNGACNTGSPTDGNGFILDSPDATGQAFSPYRQQTVVDNNISVFNGARGIEVFQNQAGGNNGRVYVRYNTVYGNNSATVNTTICGEIIDSKASFTETYKNLAVTAAATGCNSHTLFPYYVSNGDGTDFVYTDYGYSATTSSVGVATSAGFSAGPSNVFSPNPSLANPVNPPAPSCGAFASVPACMATVIANFTPTVAAAQAYGYQSVSTTSRYDPLYPSWLCTVTNLPTGLVTPGCVTGSSSTGSTVTGTTEK